VKTVPLHGKNARGRVALVDDADYDLVMQYRWNVWEPAPKPGRRPEGPYAITNIRVDGRQRAVRMHKFLTGWPLTDHQDHNGLNNQRSNLRPATWGENARNARPRLGCSSQYKGVSRAPRDLWVAYIDLDGSRRDLGYFASELEAAYAYDAAARELHGKFACPNLPETPTQAMRDQWQAERESRAARAAARVSEAQRARLAELWTVREPETCICKICGGEFQSRGTGKKFYCSKKCVQSAQTQRRREESRERRRQREEGRLL
jgi:hypothetical protein